METVLLILVALACLAIGGGAGYYGRQRLVDSKIKSVEAQVQEMLADAKATKTELLVEAKEENLKLKEETERELQKRQNRLNQREERLQKRQESLDKRLDNLEKRERNQNKRQSSLDKRASDLEDIESRQLAELERVSSMSQDEAKDEILKKVEESAHMDMARVVREVEAETREIADRKAREIITLAIQRVASDQVAETTVSTVTLPSDDMKGRIIGRQGRNIRAFEVASGVEVVVDDTPDAIILTSFDPVRREIARQSMDILITDGRIHPARIEKVVEKVSTEMENTLTEAGESAVYEAGVHGLNRNLVRLLGRLKYRTSYGQNQLLHAVETAHLAAIIASELGADVKTARMGGLLHDIGKAMTHEVEGPHALIGADEAKKHKVHPKVINCIASHHHDVEQESIEAVIVEAADAISGARPGARRESLENYVKRIRELEGIANAHTGVKESFAIQAGRELRIIVKPEEIDDYKAITLSKDIARQVEADMQYAGQIKVTVIRETRVTDYAK
ncbi:MAG: ribonuclease Y [Chloroflexota bacterium]